MKENKLDRIEFYKSMIYSLIYVSGGTIALFSLSPSSPLHGDWTIWVIFLTIPTSVLSFAVMFASKEDPTILVLIIQLCMFLIAWRIVYSPTEIHVLRVKKK
jgi:hypothetical protein